MINRLKNILLICLLISSCTIVKNRQPNKPYVISSSPNDIEISGGNFSADERNSLRLKMATQLSDSSKVAVKKSWFVFKKIEYAPAYDSAYAAISAKNLRNTLLHMGYYQAKETFVADTAKNLGVTVKYKIAAGAPTLIDTFSYRLKKQELQYLAESSKSESLIKENEPVTKANVLGEINRLVELFRNNGYYKFTPEELRMRGDTSIEALTSVSDDPFETLRLLTEANEKRNKPTIRLAMVLNPESDSTRLMKYQINEVKIYPDYNSEDAQRNNDIGLINDTLENSSLLLYHDTALIVKRKFLLRQLGFKKGDLYSQEKYNSTLSNFSRTGVWQNVAIVTTEEKSGDSVGKINMAIQLLPAKKYGFEGNIETSFSTGSNSNTVNVASAGNLLGISGNLSLQSRNAGRQGIKITHALRAGIELNTNAGASADNFINSSEISYTNTIAVPKLLYPFNSIKALDKLYSKQTFFSTNIGHSDRIGLFKLNTFGFAVGYEFGLRPNSTITIKPLNIEFTNLYSRTQAFDDALKNNPFLRYSFNTSLVMGSTFGYSNVYTNKLKGGRLVRTFKATFEESGALLYFALPLKDVGALNKYLRTYIKGDVECTWAWDYAKHSFLIHGIVGIGLPASSKDSTLPFFKQYFGGGPNSMRGWPVRGIGPGSQGLVRFEDRTLNDRTGDMRIEANVEYRAHVAQLIPNTLALKWALFADIGNVWNFKNTRPDRQYDSTQFHWNLKDFYKQLGVNLGTGFRLDFNYVAIRLDFGFRFKRPELSENDGWKIPAISFDDLFGKLFRKGNKDEYRRWRYENFNFTISLNYPF